ncbi:hypothetical protein F5878DRAFT_601842 [Lentinula raphanica]|uniref:Uncharacterized protein n=1 Tax=Lentinula raphanica TaxID=153919 RepID=A0AA38UJW6_9AGAR|nr:hypothetical protein F5880DRAFT_1607047 [Lentinula raphanica]KAJ3844497.1 hypothetical protein F5878DRAFT_601842 [Lentinula raphanica]
MSLPNGYILSNAVSHTRFAPFRHTFTYNTVAILAELSALENCHLDTPLLFGYNKRWRSLCSLTSNPYLFPSSMAISHKITALLQKGGYQDVLDGPTETWMLSMPSYLGFEGINPLTVYFLYSVSVTPAQESNKNLKLVLFEVHNTFGEGHVYFMRPGVNEDHMHSRDHQWTFPRAFHVSPFNDRKGWYTVSIKLPQFPTADGRTEQDSPKPVISIQLREPSVEQGQTDVPGKTKLVATLRTVTALPLPSARNLLFTLVSYPLELFLSMPRILYQAGILHYRKGDSQADLKVYIRPEPFLPPPPSFSDLPTKPLASSELQIYPASGAGLTIRRRPPGVISSWAKERVRDYLSTRVKELAQTTGSNITEFAVVLVEPDAYIDTEEWFLPDSMSKSTVTEKGSEGNHTRGVRVLQITPLSSEFFELLVTAPSAGMALFAGGIVVDSTVTEAASEEHKNNTHYARILNSDRGPNDALFVVNDPELFLHVFNGSLSQPTAPLPLTSLSLPQRIRLSALPSSLSTLLRIPQCTLQSNPVDEAETHLDHLLHVPERHFLDFVSPSTPFPVLSTIQGFILNLRLLGLLMTILTLSALEPRIFAFFRARMESGTETWSAKIWERVERRVRLAKDSTMERD